MSLYLNIVSFDVPFPANYGGVIDVYYKLLWLKRSGVKVILHCFAYGRPPAPELEACCEKVFYYPRKTGLLSNLSLLPYNVRSRQSAELEANLLANPHPILFEVLHTCYLLDDTRFAKRKKIYRHSNIEHDYYRELARAEKSLVKKLYLRIEATKLKRFESILHNANLILAVNQEDTAYFRSHYAEARSLYLPSFHPNDELSVQAGRGDYVLYHGNLSISENYESALWLIKNVFSKTAHPVIIAGLNPPAFLAEACKPYPHIRLVANPPEKEMSGLIANAAVHCLYTPQGTGLKLKLLNVLFRGRFILCNPAMLAGTGLKADSSLHLADTAQAFITALNDCMVYDFSPAMLEERRQVVAAFSNFANAQKLVAAIF